MYLQIPSVQELAQTIKLEVQRAIPLGREHKHFVSLSNFQQILRFFEIQDEDLSLDVSWEEALVRGEKLQEQLLPLILHEDSEEFRQLAQDMYAYLAEEDEVSSADLIMAFGAKTTKRVEKAVSLYKQNFGSKLLFSGKGPTFVDNIEKTEAEIYFDFAIKNGIPESAIILEKEAITLPDNVRRTLNLLDEISYPYKRVILVNSPYIQRRASGYFKKYCPWGVEVIRVNCETKENLTQEEWFKNEEGIRYVLGEFRKIWISLVTNSI